MEKKAQSESFKLYSDSSQIINKNNSKENLCNGTTSQTEQQKVKNTSRLPRIVRMPTRYYKPIENSSKSNDDSGDSLPGTSKLEADSIKMKKEDTIPEKLKISHIPRLKSNKERPKETSVPSKTRPGRPTSNNQFIPECRNVQRVNLLINPDFCPDDRAPPASIQATRPIPTLGQIYGHLNMFDSERFDEWFMELETPMNSTRSSNGRITNSSEPNDSYSSDSSVVPAYCHQEDLQQRSTIVMDQKNNLTSGLKLPNEYTNSTVVGQFTDVEIPTRDNDIEFAYKTMRLKQSQKSKPTIDLKKSQQSQVDEEITMNTNQTYCVGLVDPAGKSSKSNMGVECSTGTSSLLKEQPTVVLCGIPATQKVDKATFMSKSYVSLKSSRLLRTIEAKNNKMCCSNANQTVVPESRVPVPSYIDCFSEVLQNTTNFEVIEGIEPTKTASSGTAINTEMRNIIPIKKNNRTVKDEMIEVDNSTTTYSSQINQSKSSDNTTLLKTETTDTEWSSKYQSELSSEYNHRDSFNFRRDMTRRYYDDSLHNETKELCNKCHRFKRFPSTRYKLPRSFRSWRSGGSIRRLCCLRWNHVWKKTAERWAIWSTRSPTKSRRFHPMKNFIRSVIWEDVNIQTNTLVYSETGTDSTLKEQKSAAINTTFNMGTFQTVTNLVDSGSKMSNKFKNVNSGPSMFPFLLNTKLKSSGITTMSKNLSGYQFPNCLQNQCTSYSNKIIQSTDAAMGLCNSVKSCQYQGEVAVQEQTTSMDDEMQFNLAEQPTSTDNISIDNADVPNFTTDQRTSVLTPPTLPPPPAPPLTPPVAPSPPPTPPVASSIPPVASSIPLVASSIPPVASSIPPVASSIPPVALSTPPVAQSPPSTPPVAPSPPPIPPTLVRFSMQELQINKDTCKTDTIQQNVILCQNAEAELNFPFCGVSSSITVPSESDITYYRPVAGSDITQLVSETRTQQALIPILRKFYSNAACTVNRERENLVTDIGTQITPKDSVETTSMGVITNTHPMTDITTSFSTNAMNDTACGRVDCAIQTEEFTAQTSHPAQEIEMQMTPLKATSVVSTGNTISAIGEKDEVFMSECVLMCDDAPKASLAIQTRSSASKLAFTGPRIVSISSQELPQRNITVLDADEKALGSQEALIASSKSVGSSAPAVIVCDTMAQRSITTLAVAVGNNVAMESRTSHATVTSSVSSGKTACSKCSCTPVNSHLNRPREVVSCATGPNTAMYNFSRCTSARGLDSYYETEMLLNNLIKKALIGNNVGSHHTRSTDKSDTSFRSRHNLRNVTTSTNTSVGILETKAIRPTASDMRKLTIIAKADAEIQYIEQMDKKEYDREQFISACGAQNLISNETPTQTEEFWKFGISADSKSASIMTSYCGLPAAIQVPPSSMMSVKTENSRKSVVRPCSSHMIQLDMETNTDYKQGPVMENLAQTSMVQTTQKSLEVNIFRNCSSKPVMAKPELPNNINDQLLTLSRLIGKKRTNSNINSQVAEQWMNGYPSVNPSPRPTSYSNSFKYNSKIAFESITLDDNENRKPCTFSSKTDTNVDKPMPYEPPTLILSKDSLADVLPVIKSKLVYSKNSETDFALNRLMVDEFTSDNYVTKDVKESILQACPEIRNTESPCRFSKGSKLSIIVKLDSYVKRTESPHPNCSKKSACVLTTQCVLPPSPPCGGQRFTPANRDCVFLYGEPRCVVHNVKCVDTAIQLDPPAVEVNVRRKRVTHSVGQLTSHCTLRDGSQRNSKALISEVLSPKVYKALYDTTKLVVNQDSKHSTSRNGTVVAARVDAEVDAAKFNMPKLKSASVLTSKSMMGSQSRCCCESRGTHFKHEMHVKRSEESHRVSSHMNQEETNEECCEACVRSHLVTSCRYYSNLLTKHLGRVKHNLTKHLAPSMEKIEQQSQSNSVACTMKPSGRNVFASQTDKYTPYYKPSKHLSCGTLSPATSLTNICKYDKAHLKSVYFMLSAIEGRLRRLKLSSPCTCCQ